MKVIKKISFKQKGATLILAAFIIALAATVYVLKAYDPAQLRLEQDKKTYLALNEAKQALISWAVSNSVNPGQMPFPDRNADGNYDGRSDCPSPVSAFSHSFLIGQLPLYGQTNPCISPQAGLGINTKDGGGNPLFYAVSRNLVHKYDAPTGNPIINPSIISSPTHPWLKVLDANGVPVSNRVAAVIIAPKDAIGSQDRTGVANIINYLDTFLIGSATFSNSDYDSNDEDFVINRNSMDVNDKLVYVTIDELMYALEKRVLQEAKNKLTAFYSSNNYYPYAAGFGLTANQNQCVQGNYRGLLPVVPPTDHVCSCSAFDKTCRCNFSVVKSVSFTKASGNFVASGAGANSPTGACSVDSLSAMTCTCSGPGVCKNDSGAQQFECNACGVCTATVDGANTFDTSGTFTNSTGSCAYTANQASCTNDLDGTFVLGACDMNQTIKSVPNSGGLLPAWFMTNQWEKHIVYALSTDCDSSPTPGCASNSSPPKISVGVNANVNAMVAGSLVNPNNSCSISSYLNGAENINLQINNGMQDYIYQATQTKTLTITDQLVTVP